MKIVVRATAALVVGVLTLAVGSVAVLLGPPLAAQWLGRTHVGSLDVGGRARTFRVYRPATPAPRPGLVIDLHSSHTNGLLEELATRFDAQAGPRGWIVAYPDAIGGEWEPFDCCGQASAGDVAFIGRLIDRLRSTDRVDPDRVYVTGLSRGAEMAYWLGCRLSARVAAIAPVEGNMSDEHGNVGAVGCRPERPVSVLAVHGTADSAIPIGGSDRFAPLTAVIGRWRQLDGCSPAASVAAGGWTTTSAWRCRADSEVRSVVVSGSGHTWPGTPLTGAPWGPASSLDATAVVAAFFASHRRAPAPS